MNAPTESVETIKALLPSMKSPTIMPLAETEMVAIHSVIPYDQFWDVMEQLRMQRFRYCHVTDECMIA